MGALPNSRRNLFAIGLTIVLLYTLCLGGCSPKHYSYSEFKNIPSMCWYKGFPIKFEPEFGDSTGYYDISVAYTFDNDYKYANMSIIVDIIKDNKLLERKIINSVLSDNYGNWRKPGFGAIFQCEELVLERINAKEVDKIILWQGMNLDSITDISKVGIIARPSQP